MPGWVTFLLVLLGIIVLSVILLLLVVELADLEVTAKAAVFGALAAGLVSIVGALISSAISSWTSSREVSLRLKESLSKQAMELARMEYDLRTKTNMHTFLAPAKVYREFYLAIEELILKGSWPKKIEEQGLLDVFTLNSDNQ